MMQCYEIRVKGHLDPAWSDWFDGLKITHNGGGESLIMGPIVDQAALRGLLNRISDLGLSLISVNPVEKTPDNNREDRC